MDIVIIGSSAASKSAVDTLLRDKAADINITVVTRDKKLYYSRVLLPNFIAGEIEKDNLQFVDDSFFLDPRLRFINGNVNSIDISHKRILIEEYGYKAYNKLIITTGTRPVMPYSEATDAAGICCLRDLENALEIKRLAETAKDFVIIGGGLVSLKAAWALKSLGKEVTVLVESGRVLSRIIDQHCSSMVRDIFKEQGVDIVLGANIEGFCTSSGRITGVRLGDGNIINCDAAIVGKGVKPDIALAKDTAIDIDRGILVDRYMHTSVEDIYAAGDVAQSYGFFGEERELYTLWPDAVEQGKIAACSIMGINRQYQGGISMNSVKFYGVPFISIGKIIEEDIGDCSVYVKYNEEKRIYRKVIIKAERIVGAVFAGDVSFAGMVYWDIRAGREAKLPEKYLTKEGLEELYLIRNKQI